MLVLTCSGCWDADEIDRRASIFGIGLDPAPDGQVRATAQIPIFEEIFPPNFGGGAVSKRPFFIISSSGPSVLSTFPALQSKTARSLFYGQLKVIIINSEIARQGLVPITDFLQRSPHVPPQAEVYLTDNDSREILDTERSSKTLPANHFLIFSLSPGKKDLSFPNELWKLVREIITGERDAYLPFVSLDQAEETYIISDIGVFNGARMAGRLTGNEARMFGLITGKVRNTYLTLVVSKYGRITFQGVRATASKEIRTKENLIGFKIKLKAQGYLVEITSAKAPLKSRELREIKKATEKALKTEIITMLAKLQSLNSDPVGFGETIRSTRPNIWKRINWKEEYPQTRFDVEVKFNIPRLGIYR